MCAVVIMCAFAAALGVSAGGKTGFLCDAAGTTPTTSVCTWNGVYCSDGNVQAININFASLSGTLPSELGGLSSLTYLRITNNPKIHGTIPTSYGKLTKLSTLVLSIGNSITGTVPSQLCPLAQLSLLYFDITSDTSLTCYPSCLSAITSFIHGTVPVCP